MAGDAEVKTKVDKALPRGPLSLSLETFQEVFSTEK
jgi:hypothetical protein